MADQTSPSDNSSAKAFGGVVAIIAVISGVIAMINPINQRIDFIERQMKDLKIELRLHMQEDRQIFSALHNSIYEYHLDTTSKVTSVSEKINILEKKIEQQNNYLGKRALWHTLNE